MSSTAFYNSQNLVGIGSVGIGTTSIGGGQAKLWSTNDVTLTGGNYAGDVAAQIMAVGATNTNKRLALMYDTTSNIGLVQAQIYGTGTSPLCLNAAGGSVGIGTVSPGAQLTLTSNLYAGGMIQSAGAAGGITNQGAYMAWNLRGGSGGETDFINQQGLGSGGWNWYNYNNSNQLTANAAYLSSTGGLTLGTYSNAYTAPSGGLICPGNVGIGTASPQATLHVQGSTLVSGMIQSASAAGGITTQGAYMTWNLSGSRGETDFINQQGLGGGGWNWYNYNSSNQLTANAAYLSSTGGLTLGTYSNAYTAPSGGLICPGSVGIGTTSPAQMLHVTANAFINSVCIGASNTTGGSGCISLAQGFNMLDASNNYPFYGLGCSSINGTVNLQGYSGVYIGDNANQGALSVWNGGVGIGTYARYTQRGFAPPTNGLIVSGNVGIGTASPNALLDIYGANPTSRITNSTAVYGGGNSTLLFASQTAGLNDMAKIVGVDAAVGPSGIYQGRLDFYAQYNVGLRLGMSILGTSTSGCNVGIGLAGPSYQLDLSTDGARKLTTTTWLTGSDERIKTDIQSANLQVCYDIIKSIDLKYFKWNFPESSNVAVDDKHSLGFIAQEVKAVFPNAVSESNSYGYSDFLSLNTDQILKAMYGALKQTIADKEALEQSLATATANFSSLEARLAALEAK